MTFAFILLILGVRDDNMIFSIMSTMLFFATSAMIAEIETFGGHIYTPPEALVWMPAALGIFALLNFVYLFGHHILDIVGGESA